ncbi:MAG: DUF1080 domain-containing protein [Gemmataceae bacterium]
MRPVLSLLVLPALLWMVSLGWVRAEEKDHMLFNGKDLTGWRVFLKDNKAKPEDCFSVKDGVIECTGKPNGYLITEKEYGNYILELEWKWGEEAKKIKVPNSGVLLHVSGQDMIWPKSAEAQLMSGNAGDIWLIGGFKLDIDKSRQDPKIERHYFKMKTDKPVEKPMGEWNSYRIVCKGDTITLYVNEVKLNEGTNSEREKGKIALQSEGAPISFRNIRLIPIR